MTHFVTITLPGEPRGKGRPRFTGDGPVYTPRRTREYEQALAWQAKIDMRGRGPAAVPLRLVVIATFLIPKSWSAAKREAALSGQLHHISRPDCDNIAKIALDACNKIVWCDDSQVVDIRVMKRYGAMPSLQIEVHEATLPRPQIIQQLATRIKEAARR